MKFLNGNPHIKSNLGEFIAYQALKDLDVESLDIKLEFDQRNFVVVSELDRHCFTTTFPCVVSNDLNIS